MCIKLWSKRIWVILLAWIAMSSYEYFQNIFYILFANILYIFGMDGYDFLDQQYFRADTMILVPLLLIYLCIFLCIKKDTSGKRIRLDVSTFVKIIIMTLGMFGISTIWFICIDLFFHNIQFIQESLDSFTQTWNTTDEGAYIWTFLSVVILGPIVEELLFRGIIFHILKKTQIKYVAIIGTGILFGIFHLEPVQVVYTACVGILLGIVYEQTNNLYIVIWIHILNNFLSEAPTLLYMSDAQYVVLENIALTMIIPMFYVLENLRHQKIENTDHNFA